MAERGGPHDRSLRAVHGPDPTDAHLRPTPTAQAVRRARPPVLSALGAEPRNRGCHRITCAGPTNGLTPEPRLTGQPPRRRAGLVARADRQRRWARCGRWRWGWWPCAQAAVSIACPSRLNVLEHRDASLDGVRRPAPARPQHDINAATESLRRNAAPPRAARAGPRSRSSCEARRPNRAHLTAAPGGAQHSAACSGVPREPAAALPYSRLGRH
mmetsp:Transcript_12189/g.25693  ORF Transcript_12189/g.25693 Transcript_12189/m.25693 type:complete len:214 (+) Transcript_12189:449-1090(+)